MFSNVKSQIGGIGGWLGSNIPKLRKGDNEHVPEGQLDTVPADETAPAVPEHTAKEEDDNSR